MPKMGKPSFQTRTKKIGQNSVFPRVFAFSGKMLKMLETGKNHLKNQGELGNLVFPIGSRWE